MFQLKVTQQEEIITLKARGWSARRIARELGFDRDTIRRYLCVAAAKAATLTPGSGAAAESNPATPTPGSGRDCGPAGDGFEAEAVVDEALASARANASLCERWKTHIEAGLDQQLSAKRIHQDLVREHGFVGGYQSVKRFVRKLEQQAPVPFRRMEFAPGEQMQVDFGQGAWVVDAQGRKRRPHLFRAVLSCSRKGYSEAVWDQKTETFIRCIENAIRYFGGAPSTITPDYVPGHIIRVLFPTALCGHVTTVQSAGPD
jgi:transposase